MNGNVSTVLNIEISLNDIKTELLSLARDESSGSLKLLVGWCPVYRCHELNIGFLSETFELVAKMIREKLQEIKLESKIPKLGTRAEKSVVVKRSL